MWPGDVRIVDGCIMTNLYGLFVKCPKRLGSCGYAGAKPPAGSRQSLSLRLRYKDTSFYFPFFPFQDSTDMTATAYVSEYVFDFDIVCICQVLHPQISYSLSDMPSSCLSSPPIPILLTSPLNHRGKLGRCLSIYISLATFIEMVVFGPCPPRFFRTDIGRLTSAS